MSTPETNVENIDNTDLDAFNDLFHGKTPESTPEDDGPKDNEEKDDDPNAPIEHEETQTNDEEDDTSLDTDDDGDKEKETPKPKSRAEKRIEQLLERVRLAEAEVESLKKAKEPEAPKPAPTKTVDDKAPKPDDKNEDGTDKYPLGQFDEAFQEDRFNYMMEKSLAEQKAALEQQRQEHERHQAQEALAKEWTEKLEPARERYPDFQEKGEELLETFAGLDKQYGEYLTTTLMGMDHGPDVLYYLSNNIEEAENIVKLGPLGATIALGRIEARFLDTGEEKPTLRPKPSKAPPPPPRNKGSNAAVVEVPDDTDDLDAFAAKMFKKR